jgi:regulator of sigma E protease
VGVVKEASPAALAGFQVGDRILDVGGQPVQDWGRIEELLVPVSLREARSVPAAEVTLQRGTDRIVLPLQPVYQDSSGFWSVGLEPWNTRIGLVQKGGPAARLGLRRGDLILSVDGQEVTSFSSIVRLIHDRAGQEIPIVWERDGRVMQGAVKPELKEIAPGQSVGRVFMEPYFDSEPVGFLQACRLGYERTVGTIAVTLETLGDFVRRKLGLDSVGGPLRIGQAAGEMLRWSFAHLMYFVAFFSINLFLLNLMPIPVLDGGHVLFLFLEVVRGGKPVPERLQAIATQMGLIFLLLFMTFVVVLDVWKVTGH